LRFLFKEIRMGETTSIGWTATVLKDGTVVPGATFNPFIGCTPWGPGCQACYAARENERFHWVPAWGKGQPRKRTSAANWRKPLKWAAEAVASGIKNKIFGDSLCDFLDDEAPMQWKLDYFDLIDQCGAIGNVEFLLLTKRSENLNQLPAAWLAQPPGYVRIGVTAENQQMADKRIPELLRVWKGKNFISVEPMLERVVLFPYLGYNTNIGESGYDQSNERRNSVLFSDERGMENRRSGPGLERIEESGAPFGERVLTGAEDDKRSETDDGCSQIGLSPFQREDSRRDGYKPYEREERRQQAGELGSSNTFGEFETCLSDRVDGRKRAEESSSETYESPSRGYQGSLLPWRDNSNGIIEGIQSSVSNDIRYSTRGNENQTTGSNDGLYEQETTPNQPKFVRKIHQVICGAESGPGARAMQLDWARSLRDECVAAGVPYFLKQAVINGKLTREPFLDGRQWLQFPEDK
jgi:protein gp37